MPRKRNVLAAVDLGTNSFHMVVARQTGDQLVVIDRLREMVRLGDGVDEDGRLDPKVAARAMAGLERFGQRLLHMRANCVRVVGTSALRRVKRNRAFLERARKAIGHPIEIISGQEEARLIYRGVSQSLPRSTGRRLVVDIGGGSTELIIGRGTESLNLESLKLGCVAMSNEHFGDGKLTPAPLRACASRSPTGDRAHPTGVSQARLGFAVGSSGTIRALYEALCELDPDCSAITPAGLNTLIQQFVAAGHVSRLPLESIVVDRRPVIAGGLAILAEVFSELGIKRMQVADGAMREGVLHELVGRLTAVDARERTVRSMQARYQVDLAQAARVEATAVTLLRQVRVKVAADGSAGGTVLALGCAPARNRPRCRTQRVPPARSVPARECRYARLRS